MVKHSDPLKYYSHKTKKKSAIHNESIKNLDKLIAKRGIMEEDEDEIDEKDQDFKRKMFKVLEKTN